MCRSQPEVSSGREGGVSKRENIRERLRSNKIGRGNILEIQSAKNIIGAPKSEIVFML